MDKGLLIKNGWILTLDSTHSVIENGWVWIEDNIIREVGVDTRKLEYWEKVASKTIDAKGKIIMPGLVNGHTHLFQTFMRGLADDKPLLRWLHEVIWPFSTAMEEHDFYLAGLLGCIENIKSGTTSVIDQHYVHTTDQSSDMVLNAMKESGIRGVLCRTFSNNNPNAPLLQETDDTIMKSLERLNKEWHGTQDGRLSISVGPISVRGCTKELHKRSHAFAQSNGLKFQIHTAETESVVNKCLELYDKREVEFLYDIGILGVDTQLVHGIWVNDQELELIRQTGTTVIHCPISNMYIASGVARVPEMRERGIKVTLGQDIQGVMMEVLKMGACLHKVNNLDSMVLQPEDMIDMATNMSAQLLGCDNLGRIVPGYIADIILVDWEKPHIAPVHKPESAIVFNANGNDVHTTIVNGKVLMENYQINFADEKQLIRKCQKRIREIGARL